jgi:hypothetical protein
MKPKQYKAKYDFTSQRHFDNNEFLSDLMDDFSESLKAVRLSVGTFLNCLENIKKKFDLIFAGSAMQGELAENFWKYVFATRIIPIRKSFFANWDQSLHNYRMATEHDYRYEANRKRWAERDRQEWQRMMGDIYRQLLENALAAQESNIIKAARNVLSYDQPLNVDNIKAHFRDLAKFHHPDVAIHNGISEQEANERIRKFIEARDVLLAHC